MRIFHLGCALIAILLAAAPAETQGLPGELTSKEFWNLVTELSEPDGSFFRQYMSNEDSAQYVIPALKETTPAGGVYIGVGLEQNFTYVATLQPRMAFIVDIRRDNMIEHLMYKALFELAQDRAEFVSRLFSRKRPAGLDAKSGVTTLFEAFGPVPADSGLYEENVRAILDHLANVHEIRLGEDDQASMARILTAFRTAGPQLRGQGDATNPTYVQLMTGTDLAGRNQGYLASEESFRFLQQLQKKNLIVPLVGDFAGPKTLAELGEYLKDRGASVNVFYVSNVERYLFPSNTAKFYANTAALPLTASSVFIRSVTSDISVRLGIPIPDVPAKWRSFLVPINETLRAFADGRLKEYTDLFLTAR